MSVVVLLSWRSWYSISDRVMNVSLNLFVAVFVLLFFVDKEECASSLGCRGGRDTFV